MRWRSAGSWLPTAWVNRFVEWESSGTECAGISRFDGSSWSHYLEDHCIYAIDAGSDGSIWLQAGVPDYEDQTEQVYHTYVITPEATTPEAT